MEKERDELQLKVELLERQVEEFSSREAELQKLADQARALKDEVSVARCFFTTFVVILFYLLALKMMFWLLLVRFW